MNSMGHKAVAIKPRQTKQTKPFEDGRPRSCLDKKMSQIGITKKQKKYNGYVNTQGMCPVTY